MVVGYGSRTPYERLREASSVAFSERMSALGTSPQGVEDVKSEYKKYRWIRDKINEGSHCQVYLASPCLSLVNRCYRFKNNRLNGSKGAAVSDLVCGVYHIVELLVRITRVVTVISLYWICNKDVKLENKVDDRLQVLEKMIAEIKERSAVPGNAESSEVEEGGAASQQQQAGERPKVRHRSLRPERGLRCGIAASGRRETTVSPHYNHK